jgi:hypothetical protein
MVRIRRLSTLIRKKENDGVEMVRHDGEDVEYDFRTQDGTSQPFLLNHLPVGAQLDPAFPTFTEQWETPKDIQGDEVSCG